MTVKSVLYFKVLVYINNTELTNYKLALSIIN